VPVNNKEHTLKIEQGSKFPLGKKGLIKVIVRVLKNTTTKKEKIYYLKSRK